MKTCDTCGNYFNPTTSNQIRCSDPGCRRKYWRDKFNRQYRVKHAPNWEPKPCAACGIEFDPGPMRQAKIPTKCDTCKLQPKRREPVRRSCDTCGASFLATPNHHYCQDICKLVGKKIKERIRHQQRRQQGKCARHGTTGFCEKCHSLEYTKTARRKRAYVGGKVSAIELAEQQRWKCSLCDGKLESKHPPKHHLSITIDHTIPRSLGGTDDATNLTAAHLICNIRKGNRSLGPEQLRLVS